MMYLQELSYEVIGLPIYYPYNYFVIVGLMKKNFKHLGVRMFFAPGIN